MGRLSDYRRAMSLNRHATVDGVLASAIRAVRQVSIAVLALVGYEAGSVRSSPRQVHCARRCSSAVSAVSDHIAGSRCRISIVLEGLV